MKHKMNNKGVSLPLAIGLLFLLAIIATTATELVIRALRAAHQIEASDRAYFAAEAGIEDALYELSVHYAGYETPDLTDADARTDDYGGVVEWRNQWEIKSTGLNDCSIGFDPWEGGYSPTFCGRIYEGQKVVISLFNDIEYENALSENQINTTSASLDTLDLDAIEVKFRLPKQVVSDNSTAFSGVPPLQIDNDGDFPTEVVNEDGEEDTNTCPYSGAVVVDDGDCDGKEDEDSEEDPVILWKLIDEDGNSFVPLRGCKGDTAHPSHDPNPNAVLCEKNFTLNGNELWASLVETDEGVTPSGIQSLLAFVTPYALQNKQLQMEILVVAPMEAVDTANSKKVPIPYLEYGIEYTGDDDVPSTVFKIRSDGFYRDFKQSITTTLIPRVTTRLLDLTVIQQ